MEAWGVGEQILFFDSRSHSIANFAERNSETNISQGHDATIRNTGTHQEGRRERKKLEWHRDDIPVINVVNP